MQHFQVFHTESRHRYEDIENNVYVMDRKLGICFETDRVQVRASEYRAARCFVFKPNIPIWVNFGGP
jgi:hypothetical protein